MRATVSFCSGTRKKSIGHAAAVLSQMWPPLLTFQSQGPQFAQSIFQTISADVFRETPGFALDVLEQLIAALDLIQRQMQLFMTRAEPGQRFELQQWLDTSAIIVRMFGFVAQAECQGKSDKPEMAFLDLFGRYCDYLSFGLDLFSYGASLTVPPEVSHLLASLAVRDIRDKFQGIIITFAKSFGFLPHHMASLIINGNVLKLLPCKTHHFFHKVVHQEILKNLKDPNLYYSAFFGAISSHFDVLFSQDISRTLLDLVMSTFQEAFATDGSQSPQSQQQALPYGNDLFEFVLKVICSRRTLLYEKLFMMLHQLVHQPNLPRLAQFFARLKQLPFSISSLLRFLSEDPKHESFVSLLALFLYPFCQESAQQPDVWANLFVPAIQSDMLVLPALQLLCSHLGRAFPKWVDQLRKGTQTRFIAALAATMNRLPEKDLSFPKLLLSKITDIFLGCSVLLHELPPHHEYVVIHNKAISAHFIFSAAKQLEALSERDQGLLRKVYVQLIQKFDFFHAVTNGALNEVSEFIAQKCSNVILEADGCFSGPALFAHLFVKHRYLREKSNAVSTDHNPVDFANYCGEVCSNGQTAETAVSLIDELLGICSPPLQTMNKLQNALVQASLYDYPHTREVLERRVWPWTLNRNLSASNLRELVHIYPQIVSSSYRPHRRIAMAAIVFLEQNHSLSFSPPEAKAQFAADVPQWLVQREKTSAARYDFITAYPVNSVSDPLSIIQKISDQLSAMILPPIPKVVLRVFRDSTTQEPVTNLHPCFKFGLKMIVKLMLVIPPGNAVTVVWEKLFQMLRQERYKQMIPF
jgi:hypothetical protein